MKWWFKRRKKIEDVLNELDAVKKQMFILLCNIREMRQDVLECKELIDGWGHALQSAQSSTSKSVSSIELEMLLQRGACLDNNFPRKEDL